MNDNPTRVLLFRSFLAAISLIWICGPVRAQVTGIEVVVDTAFYGANTPTPEDTFDPEGELDGYVSYLVYVNYTNPTDGLAQFSLTPKPFRKAEPWSSMRSVDVLIPLRIRW